MITQCPKTGRTCEVTGCAGCWKDSTTQDEIIRMAREAGFEGLIEKAWGIEQLERFAALVAAHEREACAKVCAEGWKEGIGAKHQGDVFAVAIRARGE